MKMGRYAVSYLDASGKKDKEGCIVIGYIMSSLLITLFKCSVASHIFFTMCKWPIIIPCDGELISEW